MKTLFISLVLVLASVVTVNANEYKKVVTESEVNNAKIELAKKYMQENNTMLVTVNVEKTVNGKYIVSIKENK